MQAYVVAGGVVSGSYSTSASILLPPYTSSWTAIASLPRELYRADASIVSGRIRVAGGREGGNNVFRAEVMSCHFALQNILLQKSLGNNNHRNKNAKHFKCSPLPYLSSHLMIYLNPKAGITYVWKHKCNLFSSGAWIPTWPTRAVGGGGYSSRKERLSRPVLHREWTITVSLR